MRITFIEEGWQDYLHWVEMDRQMLGRVNALIKATQRMPFSGIGKPEPLRNELKGWWSRRIDGEHRLVYRVTGTGEAQTLEIVACRFHYGR